MQYAHQVSQGGGSMVIWMERMLLDHRPLGLLPLTEKYKFRQVGYYKMLLDDILR